MQTLLSADQIQTRVRQMAREIKDDHPDGVHFVCVLKGAFMFLSDLTRALDGEVTLDFMAVSSYGSSTKSSGQVQVLKDLGAAIEGRDVVIVEDIVDTGLTMRYLLDNLATRRPASVKLCTLLHKAARARTRIPIDYLGFQIEDRFVVGYGLDANDRYRNVPFIGVVRNG